MLPKLVDIFVEKSNKLIFLLIDDEKLLEKYKIIFGQG